ncbi:DUF4136 domain-containing protein [Erythrobacter sp. F6033]|uniref:DUF4136 domain-containing protein n=1 Tax=Erythrobacter sp. F6033 TaxID=2926401 RepID=UPI001FF119F5|nr:DUF4136 domain-containing protein [Erythrobacter sp. F6033]MCK0127264.1 DUF4136 domain-containing protein [Erythrobacter sp. F6033]
MKQPHKTSLKRFALPVLLAAGLSACAPSFNADVSRFATTLPAPQGQTFAVVAEDPKLAGGLEFSLYADMVERELEKLGYTEAASPAEANMLVRFDYGVDNGRERVRTTGNRFGAFNDPFFGPWGRGFGFRRGFAFGFHDPFLAGPEVRSYTVYVGDIDLKIDSTATGERLFEGQAQAASRTNRLQTLVPNLVDALFTDFPGNSGETLRITIKDDGKTVRQVR